MNVLVITGDKTFGPGHPRYELQKNAVEKLHVAYWGRGAMWPDISTFRDIDIVTVQDPFWRGVFGWYVARRLGAKLNVQVHTNLDITGNMLSLFVLSRADSVRAVSQKIKSQINHPHVYVLPIYIDISKFRNIVRNPEKSLVLWIGRFEPEKDPLYALEILQRVPYTNLVMLGAGSLESELRQKAKDLAVGFAGWQDPAPYLARAAAVLSTSRHESFGASIVEALAAGVPVVAPDVGVAREAGATVVPREQLAEKLVDVLRSGVKGELRLHLPTKEEWVQQWKESLL